MRETEKHHFLAMFRGTSESYGRQTSKDVVRMFWNALARYDFDQVQAAFTAHVKTSRFMPTIADILDHLETESPAMKRPGADEAWAIIPKSEDCSVVWTEEMASAFAIARPLLDEGDKVGARMAFRSAYEREAEQARASGRPVSWSLSRGLRKDDLEHVLSEAVRQGKLPAGTARHHLAELEYSRPVTPHLLLEGAKAAGDAGNEFAKAALRDLSAMLAGKMPWPEQEVKNAD